MTIRKYTGNSDAVHSAKREGTQVFADTMIYLFGLRNLGIFGDRAVRGSSNPNPPKVFTQLGVLAILAELPTS